MSVCVIEDCTKTVNARGWCPMHYYRWQHYGDPLKTERIGFYQGNKTKSEIERFWSRVHKSDGCWEWLAARSREGYGQFVLDERIASGRGRQVGAHRYAYELLVGPIPGGLHLDHLCRNPWCVNPEHLEPVTPRTNTLRGVGPSAINATATHCRHGHALTFENTFVYAKSGSRSCRTCRRRHTKNWQERNRDTQWALVRPRVFARDGYRCLRCGSSERLSVDHVVPLARGGSHEMENLQTLCTPCNSRKGAR